MISKQQAENMGINISMFRLKIIYTNIEMNIYRLMIYY